MNKGQKNVYLPGNLDCSLLICIQYWLLLFLFAVDNDRSLNEGQFPVEEFVGFFRVLKLVKHEINDKFWGGISVLKCRAYGNLEHCRRSSVLTMANKIWYIVENLLKYSAIERNSS